jgi:hypothetical protein
MMFCPFPHCLPVGGACLCRPCCRLAAIGHLQVFRPLHHATSSLSPDTPNQTRRLKFRAPVSSSYTAGEHILVQTLLKSFSSYLGENYQFDTRKNSCCLFDT